MKKRKRKNKPIKIDPLESILKERRFWKINPSTKIEPDKTKYDRKRDKPIKDE